MTYYTAVIIICWVTLLTLAILVIENNRLAKDKKVILYVTYGIIALAALAEWFGVLFNGNENIPIWVIRMVKFFDYTLTPIAGGLVAFQFRKKAIVQRIIMVIVSANLIFQFISLFTNWMIIVDESHSYKHGPIYVAYIVLYVVIVLLTIIEIALFGRRFRKQNRISLYFILVLVAVGISLQEFFGSDIKTAYIAMTIGVTLLYIHSTEFDQLTADDQIHEQMVQITIDPLTGVSSRYAYEKALQELNDSPSLPEDLVVFSIDINRLKATNDTLGHKAGDELLCGAAKCMEEVFAECGKVYRTGGDEFIVISYIDKEMIPTLTNELVEKSRKWRGETIDKLSFAIGYAKPSECPDVSIEKLIQNADKKMYADKADYYTRNHLERRKG